jgi:lipopolysaccharide export system permease protein
MFIINEKIIFKKFLIENTYFFLLVSFSMTFIVWVIQAVNQLDIVSEDGHSFLIYCYYMLLIFPKIFGKIFPTIFFISLFYTIIRYENNNELKIFWINGINKIKFYNVLLKYTFIFFIIHLSIAAYLAPNLQNKARGYIKNSTLDFFPSLFQEKKFIDTVDKLTIFIEYKDSNNLFKNIYLKDETNEFPRIIIAKDGELILTEQKRILRLRSGKFINMNKSKSTIFNFERTDFSLSKFLTKSTTDIKVQEANIHNLLSCLDSILIKKEILEFNIECNKDGINEILQEAYSRIFKPIYLFILTAILIFLLVSNSENKKFKFLKFLVFSLGIFVIILSEISVNYVLYKDLNILITMVFPIIIFFILYFIFYKKITYKRREG